MNNLLNTIKARRYPKRQQPLSSEHSKDLLIKSYMSAIHKRSCHCQKESACSKHTSPNKLFRRSARNNKPIKAIVFVLQKKQKKTRKKKINHCSLGADEAESTRAMVVASSITSAMVMASSITFSVVASEG